MKPKMIKLIYYFIRLIYHICLIALSFMIYAAFSVDFINTAEKIFLEEDNFFFTKEPIDTLRFLVLEIISQIKSLRK